MSPSTSTLQFGEFTFDAHRQELCKGRFRVRLSASQLRLLTLFLERPGQLVIREEIARRLWTEPGTIDVERGINTAINSLRTTLGDNPTQPRFLETVVGLGYRLIAPVEVREADAPATQPDGAAALPEPVTNPQPAIALLSAPQWAMPTLGDGDRTTAQVADTPQRLHPGTARNLIWTAAAVLLLPAAWLAWTHGWTRQPASSSPIARAGEIQFEPVTFDYGDNKVTAAAMSPDGTTVAYADDAGISLHHFDGSADTAMNSERGLVIDHMAWLPNAPTLLASTVDVFSGKRQAWLISVEGYFQIDLPDVSRAEPSPDGASIAFTRHNGGELWTSTIHGDGPRRLAGIAAGESLKFILWSHNGRYLLLSGFKADVPSHRKAAPSVDRWFYRTVDARSGQVLANSSGIEIDSGFLTPDGTLRFIDQATSVGIVNKLHTAEMRVATQPATGGLLGPPSVAGEIPSHPVLTISASQDGSREAVVLTNSALDVYVAQLSEDGATLKDTVQLTHGDLDAYPHAWTADGSILFERTLDGKSAIFSQKPGQNEPRLIAKMAYNLFCPHLSPGGLWILFMAKEQHGNVLYRVPIAGGAAERVSNAGSVEDFHCPIQSAAACIVSVSIGREARAYYALDPVKGLGKELARTPWRAAHLGDWNLSPDGATIAVAEDSSTNPGINLITLTANLPTHRFVPLPGHGAVLEATWSADGKALYVECRTQLGFSLVYKELQDYGATTGRERVIDTSPSLLYAVPSQDGTKLALPIPNLKTNVWTSRMP